MCAWDPELARILYLCSDYGSITRPVGAASVRWPRRGGRVDFPAQLNNSHLHRRKSGSASPVHRCTAHLYKEPGEKGRATDKETHE